MRTMECGVQSWCRRGLTVLALLAAFAGTAAAQQTGRISGRVTDEVGAPLTDVQVYLAGANIGAITRQTGQYLMINVPAGKSTGRLLSCHKTDGHQGGRGSSSR